MKKKNTKKTPQGIVGGGNDSGSLELGLSILTPNPYTLTYMPYT
jgi:hypothetical protein